MFESSELIIPCFFVIVWGGGQGGFGGFGGFSGADFSDIFEDFLIGSRSKKLLYLRGS